MTYAYAERSLNRSFNYAKTRMDTTEELLDRAWDVAGVRRVVIPVARSPGSPIEVEVWLENNDKYVKVIWLRHRDFPEGVISRAEMSAIRATLDVYFERRKRSS